MARVFGLSSSSLDAMDRYTTSSSAIAPPPSTWKPDPPVKTDRSSHWHDACPAASPYSTASLGKTVSDEVAHPAAPEKHTGALQRTHFAVGSTGPTNYTSSMQADQDAVLAKAAQGDVQQPVNQHLYRSKFTLGSSGRTFATSSVGSRHAAPDASAPAPRTAKAKLAAEPLPFRKATLRSAKEIGKQLRGSSLHLGGSATSSSSPFQTTSGAAFASRAAHTAVTQPASNTEIRKSHWNVGTASLAAKEDRYTTSIVGGQHYKVDPRSHSKRTTTGAPFKATRTLKEPEDLRARSNIVKLGNNHSYQQRAERYPVYSAEQLQTANPARDDQELRRSSLSFGKHQEPYSTTAGSSFAGYNHPEPRKPASSKTALMASALVRLKAACLVLSLQPHCCGCACRATPRSRWTTAPQPALRLFRRARWGELLQSRRLLTPATTWYVSRATTCTSDLTQLWQTLGKGGGTYETSLKKDFAAPEPVASSAAPRTMDKTTLQRSHITFGSTGNTTRATSRTRSSCTSN